MSGANILSLVGQHSAGTWLRKIVVVDSAIVVSREYRAYAPDCQHLLSRVSFLSKLCGGVLVGARCSLVIGLYLTDDIYFVQTGAVTTCSLVERLAE